VKSNRQIFDYLAIFDSVGSDFFFLSASNVIASKAKQSNPLAEVGVGTVYDTVGEFPRCAI
jgi:hypothetical protein